MMESLIAVAWLIYIAIASFCFKLNYDMSGTPDGDGRTLGSWLMALLWPITLPITVWSLIEILKKPRNNEKIKVTRIFRYAPNWFIFWLSAYSLLITFLSVSHIVIDLKPQLLEIYNHWNEK